MKRYQDYRYELKYPLEKYEFIHFKSMLKSSLITLSKQYDDRIVQSLYFDNIELQNFNDHVSGFSKRQKIRLRWYSNSLSKLFFEIKEKNNKFSKKIIFEIENNNNYNPEKKQDLLSIINKSKKMNNLIKCKNLKPILYTKFHRSYYTYLDIRITIDKKIEYKRFSGTRNLLFNKSPVYTVIEIKSDWKHKDQIYDISKVLNFRIFRHSKYVVGMNSVFL